MKSVADALGNAADAVGNIADAVENGRFNVGAAGFLQNLITACYQFCAFAVAGFAAGRAGLWAACGYTLQNMRATFACTLSFIGA